MLALRHLARRTAARGFATSTNSRTWKVYLSGEIHSDWREVIGDGTYGPELVEGALPADLSGPTTKADGIQGLVDLPAPKVPLTGASEADDLYAQVAKNKR